MYPLILKLHLVAVVLSVLVYLARVGFTFTGHALAENKAVIITALGTMLLIVISAAGLTMSVGQYPFVDGWLTEKLGALLLYIVLAVVSLKPGMAKVSRAPLILLAIAALVYAMMVAKQHAGFIL